MQTILLLLLPLALSVRGWSPLVSTSQGFQPFCVKEANLNMSALHLVSSKELKEYSLESCISKCLETQPNTTLVMVGYSETNFFRDVFNCVCGREGSVSGVGPVSPSDCGEVLCPSGSYKCGDAKKDLLRVYCVKEECEGRGKEVCGYREPFGSHGCVRAEDIDWTGAVNIRNTSTREGSQCVWECQARNAAAKFIISKKIGDNTTSCICLTKPIKRNAIISAEFCSKLELDISYYVHCSGDLSPGDASQRCRDKYLGCVYQDLFYSNFSALLTGLVNPEPGVCQDLCRGSLPRAAAVGVLLHPTNNTLECRCSTEFPTVETVGPQRSCDRFCEGGQTCGGNSTLKPLSVYCVVRGPSAREPDCTSVHGTLLLLQSSVPPTQSALNTSAIFLSFIIVVTLIFLAYFLYNNRDRLSD